MKANVWKPLALSWKTLGIYKNFPRIKSFGLNISIPPRSLKIYISQGKLTRNQERYSQRLAQIYRAIYIEEEKDEAVYSRLPIHKFSLLLLPKHYISPKVDLLCKWKRKEPEKNKLLVKTLVVCIGNPPSIVLKLPQRAYRYNSLAIQGDWIRIPH